MANDIGIFKKINYSSQSDTSKLNIGRTNYVFSVYENDFQFTTGRQMRMIGGTDKLIQAILKIILTPLGSLLEDPLYGADLEGSIGSKLQQENYANLRDSVWSALEYLQTITADSEDPDEVIDSIDEVKAVKDDDDPRVILIYISVVTKSGKLVKVVVPQVD